MSDIVTYLYDNHAWLYWTVSIAYALTILSIVGVVVSENRNPVKSLAWITVLLMFPIGGIILYIFFGRSIKNKHMISSRNKRRLRQSLPKLTFTPDLTGYSAEARQQIQLARSLSGAPFFDGNEVEIYADGTSKFEALLNDISRAQRYINVQYYIIEDDSIGTRLRDALVERARAGVKVRVIYDHIGSIHVKSRIRHCSPLPARYRPYRC